MAIFGRVLGEKVRQTVGFTGKIDPTPNDDYMKPLKRCVTSDWAVVASLRLAFSVIFPCDSSQSRPIPLSRGRIVASSLTLSLLPAFVFAAAPTLAVS